VHLFALVHVGADNGGKSASASHALVVGAGIVVVADNGFVSALAVGANVLSAGVVVVADGLPLAAGSEGAAAGIYEAGVG